MAEKAQVLLTGEELYYIIAKHFSKYRRNKKKKKLPIDKSLLFKNKKTPKPKQMSKVDKNRTESK